MKLKKINTIAKAKILHMVLIWSLKYRQAPSRDFTQAPGGERIWLVGSVTVSACDFSVSVALIWPKAEGSLAPAPAGVGPRARRLVTTMLAPSPSFPAAPERPCDAVSD